MGLITPDYGLLFWMLVSFGTLLFILKKYAWKPILQSIKSREELIAKSLRDAEYARNEVAKLEGRNVELLSKAQEERDIILSHARKQKDKIIEEAQVIAQAEAKKLIDQARVTISREKESAQNEVKIYASQIVLQAAERLLRKELKGKENYEEQINSIIQELSSQN
jgi:F-type H+-transporting ATPase subunit b